MLVSSKGIGSKVAILAAVATVASVAVGCSATPHSPQIFGFSAIADGSSAAGSLGLTSTPTFPAAVGCTTKAGLDVHNSAAAGALPGTFGSIGATTSRATTGRGPTTSVSAASETVAGANLLGGLIKVGTVRVTSATSHSPLGFRPGGASAIADLSVGGTSIHVTSAVNTVIQLAGLGTLTLNEQVKAVGKANAYQTTNALDVRITTANGLHLPVGARVIVGTANSGLSGPIGGLLDGVSYGSRASVTAAGATLGSGPSAAIAMPCLGTNGVLTSETQAGAGIPKILGVGAITDTAKGLVTKSAGSGEMTSTIAGANLLSGVVTAGTIKADAHAGVAGKRLLFSDAGSQLLNLKVAGYTGNLNNVPANTVIQVPGVGVLYLHRVLRTSTSVEVRMIELVVTVKGQAPVGTDIKVGVSEASAHIAG